MPSAYVVRDNQTVSTAISLLVLTAPSTTGLTILKAWCTQGGSTTSAMATVQLMRYSTAGTVTNTITPVAEAENDPAAGSTCKSIATVEPTAGNILVRESFNVLNGWLYLPVPEERISVKPGGFFGMKFPSAPASQSWEFGIVFAENV